MISARSRGLMAAKMLMKGTAARMGVMKRVSLVFKAKANKALDKMEDPRETLDYSYQRQLELLTKVRRGVADVATSRKRVELQMNQLQQQSNKLEDQARKALGMGREDLARGALERKASAQGQLNDLQVQYAQMQARAGAIDELMASGALDDAVGGQRDDIQSELDMMSASSDVESELSRLKGEITAGAPKQLEGGANGNSQAAQAPQDQAAPYAPPPAQTQPASIPASD